MPFTLAFLPVPFLTTSFRISTLTKEIGAGAFGHVTSLGIKIYLVPKNVKEVKEAIKLYEEGKLQMLLEPNEPPHEH
jgi:predicted Fe-Mo cluster-binding NifX family protein